MTATSVRRGRGPGRPADGRPDPPRCRPEGLVGPIAATPAAQRGLGAERPSPSSQPVGTQSVTPRFPVPSPGTAVTVPPAPGTRTTGDGGGGHRPLGPPWGSATRWSRRLLPEPFPGSGAGAGKGLLSPADSVCARPGRNPVGESFARRPSRALRRVQPPRRKSPHRSRTYPLRGPSPYGARRLRKPSFLP